MEEDKISSAQILSRIPKNLLLHTIGLNAHFISNLEHGRDEETEEELTQRLFAGFRIMERLMDLNSKRLVLEKEDFSIWGAEEEELKKYWENFQSLKESFKSADNEFQNNLDRMNSRDAYAYLKLSLIHRVISDVLTCGNDPQSATSDLNFYSNLSSRLMRKTLELQGRLG